MESLYLDGLQRVANFLEQRGYNIESFSLQPLTNKEDGDDQPLDNSTSVLTDDGEAAELTPSHPSNVQQWVDSIVNSVAEVCSDLNRHQQSTVETSLDASSDATTIRNQETKIKRLEASIRSKDEAMKVLENKIFTLEQTNKDQENMQPDKLKAYKSKVKSLEAMVQESERRLRQKEREFDRLREKLKCLADKEKSSHSAGNSLAMDDSPSKRNSSRTTCFSNDRTSSTHFSGKRTSNSINIQPSMIHDKSGVSTLSGEAFSSRVMDESRVEENFQHLEQSLRKEISDLQEQLSLALEVREKSERTIHLLQQQNSMLAENNENLALELESRPSVKQWREAVQQIQQSEEKIRDLITYRKEVSAVDSWKSHLSTAERIKIDKKNHDLGIWLVESLPKTALVDIVQLVCRELDLSNAGDIHASIKKLKAVVRVVPQMEKIIHKVLTFLGDRNKILLEQLGFSEANNADQSFTIGHIMPTLERWWGMSQRCIELERFKDDILCELFRGDYLVGKRWSTKANSVADIGSIKQEWTDSMRSEWHLKTNLEFQERVQSLVNLEVELFSKLEGLPNCEVFVKERPDLVINRIVHHIQYLFNIKTVDKVLPTMNSIFLFTEEMKNFLASIKAIINSDEPLSTRLLIDRALKMLTTGAVR